MMGSASSSANVINIHSTAWAKEKSVSPIQKTAYSFIASWFVRTPTRSIELDYISICRMLSKLMRVMTRLTTVMTVHQYAISFFTSAFVLYVITMKTIMISSRIEKPATCTYCSCFFLAFTFLKLASSWDSNVSLSNAAVSR